MVGAACERQWRRASDAALTRIRAWSFERPRLGTPWPAPHQCALAAAAAYLVGYLVVLVLTLYGYILTCIARARTPRDRPAGARAAHARAALGPPPPCSPPPALAHLALSGASLSHF